MDCGTVSWWGFKEEKEGDGQFEVTFYSADALGWVTGLALKGHAWEWDSRGHPRQLLPVGWSYSVELEGRSLTLPVLPESSKFPVLASEAGTFSDPPESEGPKFVLRIHLKDPEIVFAAQRRRQWFFGGLILAAAVVAGLAAWQMQRSIHRQQALNEEQSNFIASVSHELRIPLATLRLLAEGLASGRIAEPNQRRQYAGLLLQETRRLGRLVENVLDFGRIEQGRKEYQFEPTDLVRLVSATVRAFEPLAAERKVRIAWTEPVDSQFAGRSEAVVELLADGVALQQALSNLLDNALKHAPEGSVVTVAVEAVGSPSGDLASVTTRPASVVRISVRDTGPGIPPEDRQRIFERFFRRGSELRRETQGVGLGLAIVRHIVSAHRGRVWVDDTPGPGACFVIELPSGEFSDGQSIPAEASPSPRPIHASDIASELNPGTDPVPLPISAPKAEPQNPDPIA
jgi:signal transduction histidine kinase